MQRLSVLFPTPLGCFDYLSDTDLTIGTFVAAPFGRTTQTGVVWPTPPDTRVPHEKLKTVLPIPDTLPLPQQSLDFINWVAKYTMNPVGMVLKMALLRGFEKQSVHPTLFPEPNPGHGTIAFSPEQEAAVQALIASADNGFNVSLLDGVTGSGKTEVYFELMAHQLRQSGQILVLLPEIILTTQWLTRFEKRFGVRPALWHSSLTPKQRRDTYRAVLNGTARVVVGARSALFLPFRDLKLIIVDEEHDSSFKQEDGVLYQARDMAVVRAKIAACPIVLSSATPSIETYGNVQTGRYRHIVLPHRFNAAVFPEVHLIDMRHRDKKDRHFVSDELIGEIQKRLTQKEQSLLFLNRRGYAPLVLCRACGERLTCPHCAAWLVEHKKKSVLQCHHCGYTRQKPKNCPKCGETDCFISCGPGVERIYEEVCARFPGAHVEQITSDTLASPKEFEDIAARIQSGAIDVLIGTQILAKGHDFANLTLVGVIDADMGLAGGDLRAGERTFQLLHQVMGRAGRGQKKGVAFLQSYDPENLIIQALSDNDRSRFIQAEMASRRLLHMPPFGKLAALIVSGRDKALTFETIAHIAKKAPFKPDFDVLGPVPAPLHLLKNKHRFRLLIKAPKEEKLQSTLGTWLNQCRIPAGVDVRLDIDPYSFF